MATLTDSSYRYRRRSAQAYVAMARKAGKVWRDHGALDYRECIADDVKWGKRTSFPRSVKLKASEAVWFSWIVYKNRKHRDRVMKKVMKDKRLAVDDGPEEDAVRRQAHDLRRLQGRGRPVKPFVISRVFDAPRERVWQAWTEVERLKQWWGPKGFTRASPASSTCAPAAPSTTACARPTARRCGAGSSTARVEAPERLVFVNSFSDPEGGLTRTRCARPGRRDALDHDLRREGQKRTLLTIEWAPIEASEAE